MITKSSRILLCAGLWGVYGCGGSDEATLATGELAAADDAPADETSSGQAHGGRGPSRWP